MPPLRGKSTYPSCSNCPNHFWREGSRHGIEEYTELKYMMLGGL